MDFSTLLKLRSAKETFYRNHPKMRPFLKAMTKSKIREGTVLEFTIKNPDEEPIMANIRVQESDIELFHMVHDLMGSQTKDR